MSVGTIRGGIPYVLRETINTSGRKVRFPFYINWLKVRAATAPLKLYFTQDDFDNDTNYVSVPVAAAATPYGEWEGPVETCAGHDHVWVKGDGGSCAMELVVFQRRG